MPPCSTLGRRLHCCSHHLTLFLAWNLCKVAAEIAYSGVKERFVFCAVATRRRLPILNCEIFGVS